MMHRTPPPASPALPASRLPAPPPTTPALWEAAELAYATDKYLSMSYWFSVSSAATAAALATGAAQDPLPFIGFAGKDPRDAPKRLCRHVDEEFTTWFDSFPKKSADGTALLCETQNTIYLVPYGIKIRPLPPHSAAANEDL